MNMQEAAKKPLREFLSELVKITEPREGLKLVDTSLRVDAEKRNQLMTVII